MENTLIITKSTISTTRRTTQKYTTKKVPSLPNIMMDQALPAHPQAHHPARLNPKKNTTGNMDMENMLLRLIIRNVTIPPAALHLLLAHPRAHHLALLSLKKNIITRSTSMESTTRTLPAQAPALVLALPPPPVLLNLRMNITESTDMESMPLRLIIRSATIPPAALHLLPVHLRAHLQVHHPALLNLKKSIVTRSTSTESITRTLLALALAQALVPALLHPAALHPNLKMNTTRSIMSRVIIRSAATLLAVRLHPRLAAHRLIPSLNIAISTT